MITEEILAAWKESPRGLGREIPTVCNIGYPAWTVKTELTCGVAVPYEGGTLVREEFARVLLESAFICLHDGTEVPVLMLTSGAEFEHSPFAAVCAEFVSPGENGALREELVSNPVGWWREWKTLLGNKDATDRVYNVLGELVSLKYLIDKGQKAIWNGPEAATYDIDCSSSFVEVKSSVVRSRRTATFSNKFQLVPPEGTTLSVFYCQFEPAQEGLCIDGLVDSIVTAGYSRPTMEEKLRKLGLPKGRSARTRKYLLHAMTEYVVDDAFPAMRPTLFVGGKWPDEIEAFTYTVSLDVKGLVCKNLLEGWSPLVSM